MTSGTEKDLDQIRKILLEQDRADIADLRALLDNPDEIQKRIEPHVSAQLNLLKQQFPDSYRTAVREEFKVQLNQSSDEIVSLLIPHMGKMIVRFVKLQFKQMREEMDGRQKRFWGRFRRRSSDAKMMDMVKSNIEEAYVIQKDSGLVLAHHALNKKEDNDMIAGMMTAIKSFGEDVYDNNVQTMDTIEFGENQIYFQTFSSFYIAVIIKGVVSSKEKSDLGLRFLEFAQKHLKRDVKHIDSKLVDSLSLKLKQSFF